MNGFLVVLVLVVVTMFVGFFVILGLGWWEMYKLRIERECPVESFLYRCDRDGELECDFKEK